MYEHYMPYTLARGLAWVSRLSLPEYRRVIFPGVTFMSTSETSVPSVLTTRQYCCCLLLADLYHPHFVQPPNLNTSTNKDQPY